ncbi:MAG: hypothetical protein MUF37_05895 [Methanoregulaceae archaeon]|nr:hypothetical protein [Methanoregulaceae archaeon]
MKAEVADLNKKIVGVPVLVVLVFISVYSAGCMGSAMVHSDPFPDGAPGNNENDLPPLFNYPLPGQAFADDGIPGIYSPGDILQLQKESPVYDPDIGIMVIRDTGDGRYEICGIVNSEGTWFRLPGSNSGLVDHCYIERIFSVRNGHEDFSSLKTLDNWQPGSNSQA